MAYSYLTYTGNGSTTQYAINFSYIDTTHIKAYLDGTVTTAFSVSGSTLTFNTAPSNGVVIRIERETPIDARLVDFQDGSVLTQQELDMSADQNFFIAQEVTDDQANNMRLTTADVFDAQSKRIINVADPTGTQDAVSKNYLENTWLSSANKTALTTVNSNIANINAVNSNSTNINSAVSNATNINLVAGSIGSVNTVANDITKVVAVANDLAEAVSEVETVADDLNETTSEIEVVANAITNVDLVGNNIANVNSLAGKVTELGLLGTSAVVTDLGLLGTSTNVTAMGLLGTSDVVADMNTLGTADVVNDMNVLGTSSNVTAMNTLGTSANVTAMGLLGTSAVVEDMGFLGTSTNVSNMATLGTSTNVSNMSTLAGITNLTNLADAHANVTTVATNLSGVNSFAERYRVQAGVPSSSNDTGDLVFDTTAGKLKVFDGSSYALAGSSVNGTNSRHRFTATAGQTTFTGTDLDGGTLSYDVAGGVAFIDVYLNGVHLDSSDYTATSGTSVVLSTGASLSDEIYITAFGTFTLASFSAGNLTSGTINLDRLPSITNAKLDNSSITINGSAVALGGSVTVGETKPTVADVSQTIAPATATTISITGTNFVAIPIVQFVNPTTGVHTTANTVSLTNATTLSVNCTLANGSYFVRIENPDGNSGRSTNNIITSSSAPTFSTGAGSLGSIAGNFSGTVFSLAGSSDSAVTFSETTSVLTTANCTLSSAGVISTTDFGGSSTVATTYTFTIRLTDAEGQTTDREFSLQSSFGATGGGQFN